MQVVRHLQPGQSLQRCPRCYGYSAVYPAAGGVAKETSPSPSKIRRTQNTLGRKRSAVAGEYAACSRQSCGYHFCTKCMQARHDGKECQRRGVEMSPSSEEDNECLRQRARKESSGRRNLKRLGRL